MARAVAALQVGDLVTTLDHGPQPIRWVHRGDHPLEDAEPDAKPVLIAAGSLGSGRPGRDLIVSPQHRMLVGGGGQLESWFEAEAFVPAKSLTNLPGIRHMRGKNSITWIHFACDRHEVVVANGSLSESLLLGPMVVVGLSRLDRRRIAAIYGAAAAPDAALNGQPARDILTVGEVRRHLKLRLQDRGRSGATEIAKWDRDLAMERYEAETLRETVATTDRPMRKFAS